jgi:hypothetical protein
LFVASGAENGKELTGVKADELRGFR